jgi:hypothetical protein
LDRFTFTGDLRLELSGSGNRPMHGDISLVGQALEQLRWIDSVRSERHRNLPSVDDEQASPPERGLLGGELERSRGMFRTVDTDHDGFHETSIHFPVFVGGTLQSRRYEPLAPDAAVAQAMASTISLKLSRSLSTRRRIQWRTVSALPSQAAGSYSSW